jgi:hypothetical protein
MDPLVRFKFLGKESKTKAINDGGKEVTWNEEFNLVNIG